MGKANNGRKCLYWRDVNRLLQGAAKLDDKDFPDGNVDSAQNYCRNPRDPSNPTGTGKFDTLWCYMTGPTIKDMKIHRCTVPFLCGECQPMYCQCFFFVIVIRVHMVVFTARQSAVYWL